MFYPRPFLWVFRIPTQAQFRWKFRNCVWRSQVGIGSNLEFRRSEISPASQPARTARYEMKPSFPAMTSPRASTMPLFQTQDDICRIFRHPPRICIHVGQALLPTQDSRRCNKFVRCFDDTLSTSCEHHFRLQPNSNVKVRVKVCVRLIYSI